MVPVSALSNLRAAVRAKRAHQFAVCAGSVLLACLGCTQAGSDKAASNTVPVVRAESQPAQTATTDTQRLFAGTQPSIPPPAQTHRKALIMGRGEPYRDPNNVPTHPQMAKNTFLALVNNRENDPKKGWTADLSWDLMERLGMDPLKTSPEELFNYIGRHKLGYRIVINNSPNGQSAPFWDTAVDNGIMPFAPHYNNTPNLRFDDPIGIKSAISVGGGIQYNLYTYGQSLEFFDALPKGLWNNYEDAAQSWANQRVAARYTRILDANPRYNIWDARQHMRQAASHWESGWTEKNGFGRVDETKPVGKLLPGPPVSFWAQRSRDRRSVIFTWKNFLMTDFAATVIARQDGPVIYRGAGTNHVWQNDVDGDATFIYWSENTRGEKSRMESFQSRTVEGLWSERNFTCLILGAPAFSDYVNSDVRSRFDAHATNWLCDVIYRPGNQYYDKVASFPHGPVVALMEELPRMIDFAISNDYRLLLALETFGQEGRLHQHKELWDRAVANGIPVVLPHPYTLPDAERAARRPSGPPRLYSAITVGPGQDANWRVSGPGLEFYDVAPPAGVFGKDHLPNGAAVAVAIKLARVLEANPKYNLWDARQHLRQTASQFASGWREEGGYGQPAEQPAAVAQLDIAPPVDIQAVKSDDGRTVTFSWQNFRQTDFKDVVIRKANGTVIYEGKGTNFVWKGDVNGDAKLHIHSRSRTGKLSRDEPYTAISLSGLVAP